MTALRLLAVVLAMLAGLAVLSSFAQGEEPAPTYVWTE
jgi:hypothetical protein